MRNILLYLFLFCFIGCAGQKELAGIYKSSCFLQTYPSVVLTLSTDSAFEYRFAYLEKVVKGKWMVSGDTLLLYSGDFKQVDINGFSPRVQYTELSEYDGYLIRRKKLYVLSINKTKEDKCRLIKQ